MNQWLTSSVNSLGLIAANNGLTASLPGAYFHSIALSFSGSAGVYTFALFENGVQGNGLQTTIGNGQSFPVAVTIVDLDYHPVTELPVKHDIRVKCSANNANFQMNYGSFTMFRVIG